MAVNQKKRQRTKAAQPRADSPAQSGWTYLSNHAHVLIYLAANPQAPLREAAEAVGITERAVQNIVHDLEEAGVMEHERVGRGNHYKLHPGQALRHPLESHCKVRDLLALVLRRKS